MWGTILPISAVAPLYSCIFPDVQLAHVRNESEVMEETSPPLPFTSGKGGAASEKVSLILLLFMDLLFVVSHGSHQTELVSNNSANEIPTLAVAHNRTFLVWLVHCLMPKYSLNADIPLSITHTYTQLQTLDLQSSFCALRSLERIWIEGAYFLTSSPHIHKSALGSGCGARKNFREGVSLRLWGTEGNRSWQIKRLCWTSLRMVVKRKMVYAVRGLRR